MSDLEKKAQEYANKIKDYENLNILPIDLERYHALLEQEFDKNVGKLEESLQEDIKQVPEILVAYEKILSPLKRIK